MPSLVFLVFCIIGVYSSPLSLHRRDICSDYPFTSGNPDLDNTLWQAGPDKFLRDFLTQKGVSRWADNIFQATVAGGTQQGSAYDCSDFPTPNKCPGPTKDCREYTPKEMFYVHLSISNLYGAYDKMHESLQDGAINNSVSTSKEMTDAFGPPPDDPDADFIFSLLMGAIGFAGLAEPFKNAANAIGGGLNVAAGLDQVSQAVANDPASFQGALADKAGKMFQIYNDRLAKTIKGIFNGDDLPDNPYGGSKADFIAGQFAFGAMVDHDTLDPVTDRWINTTSKIIQEGMLITAFKNNNPPIGLHVIGPSDDPLNPMNSASCQAIAGTQWDDTMGCYGLGRGKFVGLIGNVYEWFSQDDINKASQWVRNYNEILHNSLDCLKAGTQDNAGYVPTGKADYNLGSYDINNPPTYPRCFWNLERVHSTQSTQDKPPSSGKCHVETMGITVCD